MEAKEQVLQAMCKAGEPLNAGKVAKMRKISFLLTIAALAFVSCEKEEIKPIPAPNGTVTLNCAKPAYLSAAAVLVCAIAAAVVGIIIFIPKIIALCC